MVLRGGENLFIAHCWGRVHGWPTEAVNMLLARDRTFTLSRLEKNNNFINLAILYLLGVNKIIRAKVDRKD